LVKDKIDALVADYPFCVVTAFRYKEKGLIAGKAPLSFEPFGIALPANDPHLVNWVNNFFGILQGSEVLQKLQQLWLQPGPWLKELP
jgi:ABC-type amino acid transport substrate-binding protein